MTLINYAPNSNEKIFLLVLRKLKPKRVYGNDMRMKTDIKDNKA